MTLTVFFIVNPNANSGKTRLNWEKKVLPLIHLIFQKVSWIYTEKKGDASFYAYFVKKCGYKTVVAVGGDGTVNEVVNGLLDNPLVNLQDFKHKIQGEFVGNYNSDNYIPSLACLPMGTGSDFARTLGIPYCLETSLNIIKRNKFISCDIGKIESISSQEKKLFRYFINIGSVGASAEVVQRVNQSPKKFGKNGSYIFAAIKTLLKDNHFVAEIAYDNELPFPLDLRVLFICNGRYCGGGMEVSPNSKLTSGFFQIIQIKNINKIKSIYLLSHLYKGNYKGLEKYIFLREARKITISPIDNNIIPIECDGEQPFLAPVEFSLLSKKINVIIGE
ncbi:diacylglycerol/lipid kinase family protein [Fluviispira vulneris]|uniref:diacylglycerol/lipid kinase family protein n=1 Tax=Fluviispira vulneris TaxID=2763012 RepID=UPI0016486A92|nr:diacylglycerol kinase family protein [Fluviispira vulneris]